MAAGLTVWLLYKRPGKEERVRVWTEGIFYAYLLALLALALEGEYGNPVRMAESAVSRIQSGVRINLVPFRAIGAYFTHFSRELFLINIVGNVVMFLPWGFGLMLLWKKNRSFLRVILFSLALPVLIETCQLFIGRSVDVDDLILNFAGGCLGAGAYFWGRRIPLFRRFFGAMENRNEETAEGENQEIAPIGNKDIEL